ncbi:cytochrome c oxidase subunit 7C, mitochondrial-like [Xenia sp. Carnegie-2017]|uniref:cytochrome c oxidase subunit 7C, mitochondrial-like n=1 Tax=Xenia sp. Carnegie-2017 TaxID=2897299 RepID=UPI001F03E0A3|nr:cytochrome c oxidase subunit 7C, mitochondrial-like [Xenia sp. Carnegie-2017]
MSSIRRGVFLAQSAARLRASGRPLVRGEVENAPGENLPFQIKNKPRLLATMILFLGTGFSIPFIGVRFQMAKNSNA